MMITRSQRFLLCLAPGLIMLLLSCGNQGTSRTVVQPEAEEQPEVREPLIGDLSNVPQDILEERDVSPGDYLYRSGSLFLYTDENGSLIQTKDPDARAVHVGFFQDLTLLRLLEFNWDSVVEIEVSGQNAVGMIPFDTGGPGLCLDREVTAIEEGDMRIVYGSGSLLYVFASNQEYARISHHWHTNQTVVVPRAWLSADPEECTLEPATLSQGQASEVPRMDGLWFPCLFSSTTPGDQTIEVSLVSREPMIVLEERDGWQRVQLQNGPVFYEGWTPVPPQELLDQTERSTPEIVRLTQEIEIHTFGMTRNHTLSRSETTQVAVPMGAYGWLSGSTRFRRWSFVFPFETTRLFQFVREEDVAEEMYEAAPDADWDSLQNPWHSFDQGIGRCWAPGRVHDRT